MRDFTRESISYRSIRKVAFWIKKESQDNERRMDFEFEEIRRDIRIDGREITIDIHFEATFSTPKSNISTSCIFAKIYHN